eukprot:gnl/TRDRNA2_/TRDRNA2_74968_c0_seq2.p1 gnl/TRDRNA2_/TRDRNA2_74968_c0~~gnl/TRDRNA2_/TRDRNA2_74968_c0_seq2.p1  ORF type:complete len:212 (-),score=15.96 gnl/TRDRNA2_/TRDRNA2_74968_c0_seq2:22-657(-)
MAVLPMRWPQGARAFMSGNSSEASSDDAEKPHAAGRTQAPASEVPPKRADFHFWHDVTVRWADHDPFGHVNNVQYYSWFDTTMVAFLVQAGYVVVPDGSCEHGNAPSLLRPYVVRSSCRYFAPVTLRHSPVTVGLNIARVGRSSVHYQLGLFSSQRGELAHASADFWHVWVDPTTERPGAIPDAVAGEYRKIAEMAAGSNDAEKVATASGQ